MIMWARGGESRKMFKKVKTQTCLIPSGNTDVVPTSQVLNLHYCTGICVCVLSGHHCLLLCVFRGWMCPPEHVSSLSSHSNIAVLPIVSHLILFAPDCVCEHTANQTVGESRCSFNTGRERAELYEEIKNKRLLHNEREAAWQRNPAN